MSDLGRLVVVKLPKAVVQRYNDEFPANVPIGAGTSRPGIVVGENVNAKTVNVRFFHDGPQDHYVQNVPVSALNNVGEIDAPDPTVDKTTQEDAQTAHERKWDPALEGNGTTYVGAGPGSQTINTPADQSPAPGSPVAGVPVNPAGVNAPLKEDGTDTWEADSKE
jgi:hypothetical protein